MTLLKYTLGILLLLIAPSTAGETGMIKVVVTGLQNDKGTVQVALTNSKENYKDREEPYSGMKLSIHNKRAEGTFDNIPHGIYAIKLYHDQNDNDKLDTNFVGMPKEAYGFSNNARAKFGPPSFEKARFTLNTDSLTVIIEAK